MPDDFHIPVLKRHSASQLNSFLGYRADWFLSRIRGIRTGVGAHAWRGTAVEAGLNKFIEEDTTKEECIKHALKVYTQESLGSTDNFEIRQSIGPSVIVAIDSFEDKGYLLDPPEMQEEITCTLPGCKKELYGKLDYSFDKFIVDNKVVGKKPSSLKQDYVLQGAVYRFATGKPVKFHFVIPQKKAIQVIELTLSDEEYEYGLALATKAARCIETIYDRLGELDGELLEALFMTNPSSLYDPKAKILHSEQYGIKIPMKNLGYDEE
jgi:hypothetical protein